ncbi:MAG: alpha/beta hydrolase [Hyphomicrobiaceae bacterium]|nr:alpha/beta hydrolase [Hyphomicrobiaceae bacterium]
MTLVGIPRNPVPAGAEPGTLTAYDGTELRYARWKPPAQGRKGTVCLFGGRGEFIEKYFETVSDLRQRGFAVATMDWRGQGGSARSLRNPRKGHVEDFAQYERDLAQFVSEVVLPDCPPPYYALAHSMGGNILIRAACMRDCWFDRMVFVSPMVGLAGPASSLALTSTLSQLAVFFGLGDLYVPGGSNEISGTAPFDGNPRTSDRRRYQRNRLILEAAPQLGIAAPTIAWLRAATASMQEINSFGFPPRVHVPVLMIAAGDDKIVSNRAIDELALQLKAGDRIVIDGGRHELLQEREAIRESVWAAFDAFVPGGTKVASAA